MKPDVNYGYIASIYGREIHLGNTSLSSTCIGILFLLELCMHAVRIFDLINKEKLLQLLNQSEKAFRVFASCPGEQSHVDTRIWSESHQKSHCLSQRLPSSPDFTPSKYLIAGKCISSRQKTLENDEAKTP